MEGKLENDKGTETSVGKEGGIANMGHHPGTLITRMHKLEIVRPEAKEPG
jgi:hypothetical protein